MLRVVILLLMLAAAPARSGEVWVQGVFDCGEWLEGRKSGPSSPQQAWLLGYLSGMQIGSAKDFWRSGGLQLSSASVFVWMDNYCKANPLKNITEGASVLFRERTDPKR